jgi:hypothetical protein
MPYSPCACFLRFANKITLLAEALMRASVIEEGHVLPEHALEVPFA